MLFDNSICFLEWPEALATDRLSIVSTLDLTHHPDGPPLPKYTLDTAADRFPFSYAQNEIADLVASHQRSRCPTRTAWSPRGRGVSLPRPDSTNTLDVLEAMTRAIQRDYPLWRAPRGRDAVRRRRRSSSEPAPAAISPC